MFLWTLYEGVVNKTTILWALEYLIEKLKLLYDFLVGTWRVVIWLFRINGYFNYYETYKDVIYF